MNLGEWFDNGWKTIGNKTRVTNATFAADGWTWTGLYLSYDLQNNKPYSVNIESYANGSLVLNKPVGIKYSGGDSSNY